MATDGFAFDAPTINDTAPGIRNYVPKAGKTSDQAHWPLHGGIGAAAASSRTIKPCMSN